VCGTGWCGGYVCTSGVVGGHTSGVVFSRVGYLFYKKNEVGSSPTLQIYVLRHSSYGINKYSKYRICLLWDDPMYEL
jgi:hypothetical protein